MPGRINWIFALAGLLLWARCTQQDPATVQAPERPDFDLPIPHPGRNPFHPKALELGRALFFSPDLSQKRTHSCATCHQPYRGFSSPDRVNRDHKVRKVPHLYNLAWSPSLFWDGREKNLESLVLKPIVNKAEMGLSWEELRKRLDAHPEWTQLAKEAFQVDSLGTREMAWSLAQYVRTLTRKAPPDTGLGSRIFAQNCQSCHPGPRFSDFKIRVSPLGGSGPDSGVFHLSRNPKEVYAFRTPALAALAKQPMFYHDGRFSRLEDLVRSYARILGDSSLQKQENQAALVRYLKSI